MPLLRTVSTIFKEYTRQPDLRIVFKGYTYPYSGLHLSCLRAIFLVGEADCLVVRVSVWQRTIFKGYTCPF